MSPRQRRTSRAFLGACALAAILGPFQQAMTAEAECNPPNVFAACQAWTYGDYQWWWYECWKPPCVPEGGLQVQLIPPLFVNLSALPLVWQLAVAILVAGVLVACMGKRSVW